MRTSFSSLTGCAHTRYGWKGATHRRTPIVTRTRNDTCRTDFDGVLADAAPRRLPRTQSWDGMGVRGCDGDAGAKGERSSQIARSDCRRPRRGHWLRGADYRVSRHDAAAHRHPLLRRGGHGRPWDLLPSATSSPALGPNAGRLPRLDRLGVSDGLCARRPFGGGAGAGAIRNEDRKSTRLESSHRYTSHA